MKAASIRRQEQVRSTTTKESRQEWVNAHGGAARYRPK